MPSVIFAWSSKFSFTEPLLTLQGENRYLHFCREYWDSEFRSLASAHMSEVREPESEQWFVLFQSYLRYSAPPPKKMKTQYFCPGTILLEYKHKTHKTH